MSAMAVRRQFSGTPAPQIRFCRELIPDLRHTGRRAHLTGGSLAALGVRMRPWERPERARHARFLADSVRTGSGHTHSDLGRRHDSHVEAERWLRFRTFVTFYRELA